jgi:hypothetical protein
MSSAMTRSPPPGAHAPTQSALSRLPPAMPEMPAPPKQVQPSPGVCASIFSALVTSVRLDLGDDDVVHQRCVVEQDLDATDELVGVEAGVDEEATVVVGAGALRRLRGVLRREADLLEALALAQRRLLDRLDRGARRGGVGARMRVGGLQVRRQVGLAAAPGEQQGKGSQECRGATMHRPSVPAGTRVQGACRAPASDQGGRCAGTVEPVSPGTSAAPGWTFRGHRSNL